MDLASSKYILYAVNEDNTSASRVTDDIIIVHETGYRMDMTVVHANVRAAATCSIDPVLRTAQTKFSNLTCHQMIVPTSEIIIMDTHDA